MRSIHFLFALLLVPLTACEHHHGGGQIGTPVFVETERNDDPLTANYFGVLEPGDRFFIDGFVRDDAFDPFDGFAFTAGQPLHVDFQLFIGNSLADLDVRLYDPQIDQTVAVFATNNDPEQGGVDVFAGGLDFHLVIESFIGDASYSLEIVALPLFAATSSERPAAASRLGETSIAAVGAQADHTTKAEGAYRKVQPATRPALEIEQVITIDEHGQALEIVRIRRNQD